MQGNPVDELVPRVEVAQGQSHLPEQTTSSSNTERIPIRQGNSAYDLSHLFAGNSFNHALSPNIRPDVQSNSGIMHADGTAFSEGILGLISREIVKRHPLLLVK
jgi:hypothetical protein